MISGDSFAIAIIFSPPHTPTSIKDLNLFSLVTDINSIVLLGLLLFVLI